MENADLSNKQSNESQSQIQQHTNEREEKLKKQLELLQSIGLDESKLDNLIGTEDSELDLTKIELPSTQVKKPKHASQLLSTTQASQLLSTTQAAVNITVDSNPEKSPDNDQANGQNVNSNSKKNEKNEEDSLEVVVVEKSQMLLDINVPIIPFHAQPPMGVPPFGGSFPPFGFRGPYRPAAFPPGAFPPAAFPPGAFPPGAFPPGAFPPGGFPPGAFPPGGFPPQMAFPPFRPMPGLLPLPLHPVSPYVMSHVQPGFVPTPSGHTPPSRIVPPPGILPPPMPARISQTQPGIPAPPGILPPKQNEPTITIESKATSPTEEQLEGQKLSLHNPLRQPPPPPQQQQQQQEENDEGISSENAMLIPTSLLIRRQALQPAKQVQKKKQIENTQQQMQQQQPKSSSELEETYENFMQSMKDLGAI